MLPVFFMVWVTGVSMKTPIYLDNNATTVVDDRVLEAMLPFFRERSGNAASVHHCFGWQAEDAVKRSRGTLAAILGCDSNEIVFTSGATESDNLAIKGVMWAHGNRGAHVVTCATEHKAVLDSCRFLEDEGFSVTYLPVDRDGLIDVDHLAESIGDQTVLVSIMAANNETGVLQPIVRIGEICRTKGVLFHTDATQAFGRIPLSLDEMGVDLLSLSGHKLYGPKGIGALYVRSRGRTIRCRPLLHGGGHEGNLRSGTLNVAGIVGLARAAELAVDEMTHEGERQRALCDRLVGQLCGQLDHVRLNGHPTLRLPNTANLSFAWVEAEALMLRLDDVAVSTGSACTSSSNEVSHVLRAMSVPESLVRSCVRFSLGRFTEADQIEYTIRRVVEEVGRLREMSPIEELKRMRNSS